MGLEMFADEPSGNHNVVCFAIGSYLHEWADCISSQRRYCDANSYNYHLVTEPYGKLHPKWQKFEFVRDLLQQSKADVFLVDADAEVTASAPKFHKVIENSPKADIFCALGRSKRPNSGVILFRGGKGSRSIEFLTDCLDARDMSLPKSDFVTKEGENGHFIFFLKQQKYAERLKLLDRAWNNTDPPPRPDDFVIHYNAGPMRRFRINALRRSSSTPSAQ
jgi:hypothetical protein